MTYVRPSFDVLLPTRTGYTDPKGNGGDGHQRASYFGNTVAGMTAIYNRLKEGSRKFAANEGTLEDAGLFPQDQR